MIGIAIFEENVQNALELRKYVQNFLEILNQTYYIHLFNLRENTNLSPILCSRYDIIFVTVNSQESDGMSFAGIIRKQAESSILILVSDSAKYALEGYKVEALRYLIKNEDLFEKELEETMWAAVQKMRRSPEIREFCFLEEMKSIPLNSIIYLESNGHKLIFYIWENEIKKYTLYGTLKALTDEVLGGGFIKIHKSYSINMFHIIKLCRYQVTLLNGVTLPVSKNRYNEIEGEYKNYKSKDFLQTI